MKSLKRSYNDIAWDITFAISILVKCNFNRTKDFLVSPKMQLSRIHKIFNLDVYHSLFTEKNMKLPEIPILQYAFIFMFNFTLTVLHKHVFKENQFTFSKCFNKKLNVRKTWLLVCLYSMKAVFVWSFLMLTKRNVKNLLIWYMSE